MTDALSLSILIPFHNEAGNITPLLEEVHEAFAGLAFEVICVNDASGDRTELELLDAKTRWPMTIVLLRHVRRAGKSAALQTALRAASAPWTVLLDGDGQNDPVDARRIWDTRIAKGPSPLLGIVAGKRRRRNDGVLKWLQSRIANGIRAFALRDGSTDTGCGLKVIRTDVFRDMPYFESMHRFLPALARRGGWTVEETPVTDRPRQHGRSKYGFFGRLGAGIFDLLGMMWLVRRGGYGVGPDDPRSDH